MTEEITYTGDLSTSAAHHCPIKNSLHPDLEEVIEFIWL